jgi:hypothetical protein
LTVSPLLGNEFAFGLAREVLDRPGEHPRVREQAIEVVGALSGAEPQKYLIGILTNGLLPTDVLAAANELAKDTEIAAGFDEVAGAYHAEETELGRIVLTILMARDLPRMKSAPGLFEGALEEVRRGLASPDTAVRYFATTAYALLSAGLDRPAQALAEVLDALPAEAASLVPAIAQQISELPEAEGRPLWDRVASNPGYAPYFRAYALQGFLRARDFGAAWRAVRAEPQAAVRVAMAGMVVAEQGREGLEEYRRLAQEEQDPEAKSAMDQQIAAWDQMFAAQEQAGDGAR